MSRTEISGLLLILSCVLSCRSPTRTRSRPRPVRTAPVQPTRAFPGAEGFGAFTAGGRGGRVIEVTKLNDSGPGSFREACQAAGPRIVVFRVGGTIKLNEGITIKNPRITIAGQTAPGGGITLTLGKGGNRKPGKKGSVLGIQTHDVIVRYLRFRAGPGGLDLKEATQLTAEITALRKKLGKKARKERSKLYALGATSSLSSVDLFTARNVILDHVSASWGVDAVADIISSTNVTVQWSIFSEPLDNSIHYKGPHSTSLGIGGTSDKISFHHNLIAHGKARNPRLAFARPVDVVNNVMYNSRSYVCAISYSGDTQVNLVGNYIKAGPSSTPNAATVLFARTRKDAQPSLFLQGNIGPKRTNDGMPEWSVLNSPEDRRFVTSVRHNAPLVTTTTAKEAYTQVLARAGCTVPQRDAVDDRIVKEVRNGAGRIIDHPGEVGGWPELARGKPPVDSDHDGMPDAWETRHGFNPAAPSDGPQDADGDGYTNVEEFLNKTNPRSRSNRSTP